MLKASKARDKTKEVLANQLSSFYGIEKEIIDATSKGLYEIEILYKQDRHEWNKKNKNYVYTSTTMLNDINNFLESCTQALKSLGYKTTIRQKETEILSDCLKEIWYYLKIEWC